MNEIVDAVFSHLRISSICKTLVISNYNRIFPILKHNTTNIIIGCAFQILANKNKIDGSVGLIVILNFLSVKKTTIMSKIRSYNNSNDK